MDMDVTPSGSSESAQLQVRFITKQRQYSVPDTTFALPSTTSTRELNHLINELISEGDGENRSVEFDFLALGEFLRSELGEHVTSLGGSSEGVLEVEYVERLPAPRPKDTLLHDDWVSSVHLKGDWVLTGCYDSTVHLWSSKGKHRLTLPGHTECVKAVRWISLDSDIGKFVSGSHDQTLLLWEWSVSDNMVQRVHVCKGHTRGVEAVAVKPADSSDQGTFASGSHDTMLKIWSSDLNETEEGSDSGESDAKRIKKSKKGKSSQTRSPLMTLAGHREAVTGLCWPRADQLISCSLDHTLRLWDSEQASCVREMIASKAMLDVDVNPFNGLLLVASTDRHVRIFDPKSTESLVVKCTYSSHREWVQGVRWSPTNQNHFISGAFDRLLKLWDTRSPKVPLFEMSGHQDKVLCCDWSDPGLILSGGADNTVRFFQARDDSNSSGDPSS